MSGSTAQRKHHRAHLIARDGLKCCYCAVEMAANWPQGMKQLAWSRLPERATIEHFEARAHGGSNELRNLLLACSACNTAVGDLRPSEKLARLRPDHPWRAALVARVEGAPLTFVLDRGTPS